MHAAPPPRPYVPARSGEGRSRPARIRPLFCARSMPECGLPFAVTPLSMGLATPGASMVAPFRLYFSRRVGVMRAPRTEPEIGETGRSSCPGLHAHSHSRCAAVTLALTRTIR